MTITMTAKNQITIPKKIASILGLSKGVMFNIKVRKNKIELIPLEVNEKEFSPDVYKKLDALSAKEKGEEKPLTHKFISELKKGKI